MWHRSVTRRSEPRLPSSVRADEVRRDRYAIARAVERLNLVQPIAVDRDQIANRVVDDDARAARGLRHLVVSVVDVAPHAEATALHRGLQHDDDALRRGARGALVLEEALRVEVNGAPVLREPL